MYRHQQEHRTPGNLDAIYTVKDGVAQIDLHGFHPHHHEGEWRGFIREAMKQAQADGLGRLRIIHGHGFNRGLNFSMFANTNTGFLGLTIRSFLRNTPDLRQWMYAKIDVSHDGSTVARIRKAAKSS